MSKRFARNLVAYLLIGAAVLAGEAKGIAGEKRNLETKAKTAVAVQAGEEKAGRNYETTNFAEDSDEVLLARMLFGEARNCTDLEKIAVAYTAINRANDGKKWNGTNLKEVLLKKWQYSCFNENDPNREKLMDPQVYDSESWDDCLKIAREVLAGKYKDITNGATHYHTLNTSPKWSKSPKMKKIGRIDGSKHEFYKEK